MYFDVRKGRKKKKKVTRLRNNLENALFLMMNSTP